MNEFSVSRVERVGMAVEFKLAINFMHLKCLLIPPSEVYTSDHLAIIQIECGLLNDIIMDNIKQHTDGIIAEVKRQIQ